MESMVMRPARPADVRAIDALIRTWAEKNVLLEHDLIHYYEAVGEFLVVEAYDGDDGDITQDKAGTIVGCGALHVLWEDLAELRSIAVHPDYLHRGIGTRLIRTLLGRAQQFEITRLFCLTFETDFFGSFGFDVIDEVPLDHVTRRHLERSADLGVAEFLDLARIKPNTLGNVRMMKTLTRTGA